MSTSLSDLPPELFDHVVSHLKFRDLARLRLVDRRCDRLVRPDFSARFLSVVHFNFSSAALQELEERARSELVRGAVTKLCICSHRRYPGDMGLGFDWHEQPYPSSCIAVLASILREKLFRCRTFLVADGDSSRYRGTHSPPLHASEAVGLLLCALSEAEAPMHRLNLNLDGVYIRGETLPPPIDSDRMCMHMGLMDRVRLCHDPGFRHVCRQLKELSLSLTFEREHVPLFVSMLDHADALEGLYISDMMQAPLLGEGHLDHFFAKTLLRGSLGTLRTLTVDTVRTLNFEGLKLCLLGAGRLQKLMLGHIQLGPGDYWADLFAALREHQPRLRSLNLSFLRSRRGLGVYTLAMDYPAIIEALERRRGGQPHRFDRSRVHWVQVRTPSHRELTCRVGHFNFVRGSLKRMVPHTLKFEGIDMPNVLEYLSLKDNLRF